VAPKDGAGGVGPHTEVRGILKAIATSERCLAELNKDAPAPKANPPKSASSKKKDKSKDKSAPLEDAGPVITFTQVPAMLWLLPWDVLRDEAWEFRCFVSNQRLHAISQRLWDRSLVAEGIGWAQPKVVTAWANAIMGGVDSLIGRSKGRLQVKSYVLDVRVRRNSAQMPSENAVCLEVAGEIAYLEAIQVKPFGAQHAVGSCAYHWVNDYNTLCSGLHDGTRVEFRYVVDSKSLLEAARAGF